MFGVNVPDGHGHEYEADHVNGWGAVAQPDGWTAADTERLRQVVGVAEMVGSVGPGSGE